jgi:tetratricopeptide (TPR) repeat protein
MKKTPILLPLACAISALLGQAVSVHAEEQPLRVEPVMSVRHSEPGLDVWYKLGRQHQENKRFDLASEAYRHVLDSDAGNIDARNALATVYSQQQRYDEAVAEFETLLRANPRLGYVHNNLGYTYLMKADYPKAISAFASALALEPGNARAYGNLALAYERFSSMPAAAAPISAVATAAPAAQAEQPKAQDSSGPTAADTTAATDAAKAEDTAPAPAARQQALQGIEIEITNGTRDAKLGEYLANALRQEGATVTRVAGLKPYTQRRNVIFYRDGFYKQALAVSRTFATPPALINNTHNRASSDQSGVRLVLGSAALQTAQTAGSAVSN